MLHAPGDELPVVLLGAEVESEKSCLVYRLAPLLGRRVQKTPLSPAKFYKRSKKAEE